MSTDWLACLPRAQLLHRDFLASGHRPLLLYLSGGMVRLSFLFYFEHKWLTHPHLSHIVQQAWSVQSCGFAMFL